MIADLIILKKDSEEIKDTHLKDEILTLLKKLFINLDEYNSTFFVNNHNGIIKYKISGKSNDMLYIKLECNETPMKSAKNISNAIDVLKKGEHRRQWHIIESYDESSYYCCNQLMPYFGTFERLVRKIVYFTVIKVYGNQWFERTFEESLKKEIQSNAKENSEKLIEHALDELTYDQLKKYLFEPIAEISLDKALNDELSIEMIQDLDKTEIIHILDKCRKVSLWERFFKKDPKFKGFESKINILQKYRNKVMHNKKICFDEYLMVKKELKKINKQLMDAISIIENKTFKDIDYMYIMEHILDSFSDVLLKISSAYLDSFIRVATQIGETITKSVQDIKITDSISKEN